MPTSEDIQKTFQQRGSLQQYRLSKATDFYCSRCNQNKKAKLVATIEGDWDRLLCNGCYGYLLASDSTEPK
ncbi:hypothetical protein BDW59DRAFT_151731 [Aspergillus cavernicola]|uniref:GATA-type domain-containing protein n=1 Tax=Aspergillus cavernicola TaxID=176166 RepID=A0ABR4HU26_9EURO